MQVCTECNAIEQGTIENDLGDGETETVCIVCNMPDTIVNYNEDAGQDR